VKWLQSSVYSPWHLGGFSGSFSCLLDMDGKEFYQPSSADRNRYST